MAALQDFRRAKSSTNGYSMLIALAMEHNLASTDRDQRASTPSSLKRGRGPLR